MFTGRIFIILLGGFCLTLQCLLLVLRWAEPLQGTVQGLQVLSYVAQSVLDLAGLVQYLHAAGKGVVANCKGTLDGFRVPPFGIVNKTFKVKMFDESNNQKMFYLQNNPNAHSLFKHYMLWLLWIVLTCPSKISHWSLTWGISPH